MEEAVTGLFVEMENHLVEMVSFEPIISDADFPLYLRNDALSPGAWISYNPRLTAADSADLSQELPKRGIRRDASFIVRRCVWIHLNRSNTQDPTGRNRNRAYISLSCFFFFR
jgi:hypothetical protein